MVNGFQLNQEKLLLESGLIDNAQRMGEILLSGLFQSLIRIQASNASINRTTSNKTDINRVSLPRGKGLMVAIDVFAQAGNLDSELRDRIVEQAFLQGLLLLGCGKAAIRFCPPLVIDSDQIQVGLQILTDLLVELL